MQRLSEEPRVPPSQAHLGQGNLLLTSALPIGEGSGVQGPREERHYPTWKERQAAIEKAHGARLRETAGTADQKPAQLAFIADWIAASREQKRRDREAEWAQATKNDPEMGGGKLTQSLGLARWALDRFGDQGLYDYLDESGLGNHPDVIRMFYKAGKRFHR